MSDNLLAPLNDFNRAVVIETINATTGTREPVTTGTVTGYLATSKDSASAADVTLTVSGVYIGGNAISDDDADGTFDEGTWLFVIDAAVLTAALLATLFTNADPYFIVSKSGAIKKFQKLQYIAAEEMDVVDDA